MTVEQPAKMTDTPPPYTAETYQPRRNVMRSLVDIASLIREALDRRVAGLGVTGAQWVVLIRIASGVGSSAAELCRAMGYDSGSMTRMLDRLEKAGLIVRERCCDDRRVVKLRLTRAGEELYPQLTPVGVDMLNRGLRGFTPQEVDTLMDSLDRVMANLNES